MPYVEGFTPDEELKKQIEVLPQEMQEGFLSRIREADEKERQEKAAALEKKKADREKAEDERIRRIGEEEAERLRRRYGDN